MKSRLRILVSSFPKQTNVMHEAAGSITSGSTQSTARARTLSALQADHAVTRAKVEIVFDVLASSRPSDNLAQAADEALFDLVNAPDDFHHLLEKRLYRMLADPIPHLAPKIFDICAVQEDLRRQRVALLKHRRADGRVPFADPVARTAIKEYLLFVRRSLSGEETRLFPALSSRLSEKHWRQAADELSAYNDACAAFAKIQPSEILKKRRFLIQKNGNHGALTPVNAPTTLFNDAHRAELKRSSSNAGKRSARQGRIYGETHESKRRNA